MMKLVHIYNVANPECNEPILINLDNVNYMRVNYDFNCTAIYFNNGEHLIIKEQLPDIASK